MSASRSLPISAISAALAAVCLSACVTLSPPRSEEPAGAAPSTTESSSNGPDLSAKLTEMIDQVKQWFGVDAKTLATKREFAALEYVASDYPPGNRAIFDVRRASLSCPKISLEGMFIFAKAEMNLRPQAVMWEKGTAAVVLDCAPGSSCVEIRQDRRPTIYWQKATLVAASPALAKSLSENLASCVTGR